nr:hypothetical protein B0A51_03855 [Rachicladosporium sp. CCFEE 5018]
MSIEAMSPPQAIAMEATETMDCNASESSSSPSDTACMDPNASSLKRTASDAGLDAGQKQQNGTRPNKSVKRRAAKACQCCRNRKVRCNVVEHGAPCTNCRLDEVECIVSESKRKKKIGGSEHVENSKSTMRRAPPDVPLSAYPPYAPLRRQSEHVPHALYQDVSKDTGRAASHSSASLFTPNMLFNIQRLGQHSDSMSEAVSFLPQLASPDSLACLPLPAYIKPFPAKFDQDDIVYLRNKGAMTIPGDELRDQLLKAFIEFIHPYMPLLDLQALVRAIDGDDGVEQISLLLFQSIMFAAVASVEMMYLRNAGYTSRREARRDFFNKTRLLYDFDYESDRVSLIQSLLLMTYWYETPDDQKDSQHWMGIAVSLSHTIGLHRSPDKTAVVNPARKKLWKRIWWSTYMRDRLIALGMRRPTRIKDSDFDVSMLEVNDFEMTVLSDGPSCIPADCHVMRDLEQQRQLAIMCIEKAKLCVCVSNVLSVQYSVLHHNHGVNNSDSNTRTTGMLVAKVAEPGNHSVQACHVALQEWKAGLPLEAEYIAPTWPDVDLGHESVALNRSLLHMIYFATLSALHRPQVLPGNGLPPRSVEADVIELSRKAVRLAAVEITAIAHTLHTLDLVRLLPTTGVTVLLPAIIIHLLDIKAPGELTRRASLQGFCQCMSIMAKLRDMYAAADYSTAFLEAAIRKAEITLPQKPDEVKEPRNVITSTQGLMDAGKRLCLTGNSIASRNITPPPESLLADTESLPNANTGPLSDTDIARRLSNYLNSTPPPSDRTSSGSEHDHDHHNDQDQQTTLFNDGAIMVGHGYGGFGGEGNGDFDLDFDSMIDLDAFGFEDGNMQGETSFALDMDFMKTIGAVDPDLGGGVGEDMSMDAVVVEEGIAA